MFWSAMNVLIVLAHPNPSSFNHALAARMAEAAREAGHSVRVRDLYAERFDPVLPASELEKDAVLDPEIEAACRWLDPERYILVETGPSAGSRKAPGTR